MSLMRIDNGITHPQPNTKGSKRAVRGCCHRCKLIDVAPCPIFERAYGNGYDEMEFCEMLDPIQKVWDAAQVADRMGPAYRKKTVA